MCFEAIAEVDRRLMDRVPKAVGESGGLVPCTGPADLQKRPRSQAGQAAPWRMETECCKGCDK